ncbi:hypothetical protein CH305_18415 [Rhodococcus sp. 15-649-2-2]|nr:hypothetical protein CH305_18415 [Rhodococcus sp. 15-649-2-2]
MPAPFPSGARCLGWSVDMARGGARANSGPPPDPMALRRDRPSDKDGWTTLPSEGRTGPTPKFPLSPFSLGEDADPALQTRVRQREAVVWRQIWRTPQAVQWERFGWSHDVAIYVRMLVIGENGDVKALSEARQWSDRLGLNPAAMLRNRWRVASDEMQGKRAEKVAAAPKSSSSRSRMKVVPGGGA